MVVGWYFNHQNFIVDLSIKLIKEMMELWHFVALKFLSYNDSCPLQLLFEFDERELRF